MSSVPTPERWRRLQDLFAEAMALRADERARFVASLTVDDEELRAELSGMLAHAGGAEARIRAAIEGTPLLPPDPWVGRRLGHYTIVREVGRGGMGVVFEAVRHDDVQKRVALKVAPWAGSSAELDARFRLERQILAGLEHPTIARFLDAGTDGGTPYFVMEFVEGVPVTDFCRDRGATLPERLEIARQICGALQYAHQSLVVHRDLKPGNILVTADGLPKVLDFGLARLLDPNQAPGATIGATAWTPDYASPEQVVGGRVDTRTDVYSFGLVLYEMLTGERAQQADTSSPLALQQSVCEHGPPLASVCARQRGDHALARRLRGDLDTIVATACHKDPARRYGSMEALAADIGRYLEARPVLARPQSLTYRAAKLLRRHRLATAAALVIAVSLAGGVTSTMYQARRAERQFRQVRTLANTLVSDVYNSIDEIPGTTEARKFIVQTALAYLEGVHEDAASDPELAREVAAGYERVGSVQGHPLEPNLGDTDGALVSFGRAQALLSPLEQRGDRVARARLAEVHRLYANTVRAKGDMDASLQAFGRARALGERMVADTPDSVEAVRFLSSVCADISRAATARADAPAAEEAGQRSVAMAERLATLNPADPTNGDHLATALNAYGSTLVAAGRLQDGADQFRRSVALRAAVVATDPTNVNLRRTLMISYGNLGDILGYRADNLGQFEEAAAVFRQVTAIAEELLDVDRSDRRARFDAVNAWMRLGSVLTENPPTLAEALAVLERALAMSQALLAEDPASSRYGFTAVQIEDQLGEALEAAGRTADAVERYEHVLARLPAHLAGPNGAIARQQVLHTTIRLARLRARTGDARAADLAVLVATELQERRPASPTVAARAFADLGRIHLDLARRSPGPDRDRHLQQALASLDRAASAWRGATLTPALEPQRVKALGDIDAAVAQARLLPAAPRAARVAPSR